MRYWRKKSCTFITSVFLHITNDKPFFSIRRTLSHLALFCFCLFIYLNNIQSLLGSVSLAWIYKHKRYEAKSKLWTKKLVLAAYKYFQDRVLQKLIAGSLQRWPVSCIGMYWFQYFFRVYQCSNWAGASLDSWILFSLII